MTVTFMDGKVMQYTATESKASEVLPPFIVLMKEVDGKGVIVAYLNPGVVACIDFENPGVVVPTTHV